MDEFAFQPERLCSLLSLGVPPKAPKSDVFRISTRFHRKFLDFSYRLLSIGAVNYSYRLLRHCERQQTTVMHWDFIFGALYTTTYINISLNRWYFLSTTSEPTVAQISRSARWWRRTKGCAPAFRHQMSGLGGHNFSLHPRNDFLVACVFTTLKSASSNPFWDWKF